MVIVFFSYSHRDEDLRNELEIHLSTLKRQGVVQTWHDRRIHAGDDIDREIDSKLETADIILFLVSPYFIASDYCYNVEMKRAMERHNAGEARIKPIILHPCEWQQTPFGRLRATPTDGKPVSKFPNQHDAFLSITKDIRVAAEEIGEHKRRKVVELRKEKTEKTPVKVAEKVKDKPRSSNLRVRRDFTDVEKSRFISESFEYVMNFFENSLYELMDRANIETDFRKIYANQFIAKIFKNGKLVSQCKIWLAFDSHSCGSIRYSSSFNFQNNSWNESLQVEDDGYILGLKPIGFSLFGDKREKEFLSQEGGAELFWDMFIRALQ